MPGPTVLFVEDNELLRDTVAENLAADGYRVITAGNAADLLRILPDTHPDAVLLDLMLPDADGLTLIARIREHTDAPVIVVSGKDAMVDKVVGLEMGADDYVAKPFEMRELSARIKANIRRYKPEKTAAKKDAGALDTVDMGAGLSLDRAKLQAFSADGTALDLTVMEFRLLESLVRAPNRVLSREQLLAAARHDNPDVYDRAIDVQITRIRKKIKSVGADEDIIRTVRGAGYMFVPGAGQ